jgi:hypothetical protein
LGSWQAQILCAGCRDQGPIAIEAVRWIHLIFAVERDINGIAPEQRPVA